jgi:hypothetical protein
MKKQLIVTIVILFTVQLSSGQDWRWANGGGGTNGGGGSTICTDNSGNTYISGVLWFPEAYFKTDTLTINGFSDLFLAKYDADGNELWIKQFGGYNDLGTDDGTPRLAYDSNNNFVYMTGSFIGNCTFGQFHLNAASSSDHQIFLAKFDLNGNCIWAKSAGGSGDDACLGINIDQNGSILISGGVSNGGTFDTIQVPPGGILAKYDKNGICLWASRIVMGGTPQSIKIFDTDIFISGGFPNSIISIDTINFQMSTFYHGKFLARFDSTGNVKWAKIMGGPHDNGGKDLSMDGYGNCYIAGGFRNGYAIFGNDTIRNDTTDFYLAKYDQNGNFKWVRQGNTTIYATVSGNYSDAGGNTYITGVFYGNAYLENFNISSSTLGDMFIARYDSSGYCIGVEHIGQSIGVSVTSDSDANAYITGSFRNTVNFGATTLVSHGSSDVFVAKLDQITGITETKATENNQLLIYANPTTGKCNITVPDDFMNEKNLTLCIFDNSGKRIQQKTLEMNEGKIRVDLEEEAKGI